MREIESPQKMLAKGKLASSRHKGFWQLVSMPQQFALLNRLWAAGNAP